MSIKSLQDWNAVELAAQTHELKQVDTPKVPTPTIEQQLLWATQTCAELQAKIYRLQGHASSALMWLSVHETQRAIEDINRCILDI